MWVDEPRKRLSRFTLPADAYGGLIAPPLTSAFWKSGEVVEPRAPFSEEGVRGERAVVPEHPARGFFAHRGPKQKIVRSFVSHIFRLTAHRLMARKRSRKVSLIDKWDWQQSNL